jgi:hypothetical protein
MFLVLVEFLPGLVDLTTVVVELKVGLVLLG